MDDRDKTGKFAKGSKINLGRVPSADQRQKQAEKMRGRVLSEEHKEKIRLGMERAKQEGTHIGPRSGFEPWNKGMKRENGDPIPVYAYPPLSEENRLRRSEARIGKHYSSKTEFKKGMKPWNVGKPCSEETLKKMRGRKQTDEARMKMSKAHKGKKLTAEHIRKALARRTPTSLEMKSRDIINKHGLPYRFTGDGSFMIGRKNPDFININGEKIAVEVYARYYKLRHKETVEQWQEERKAVFAEYGWRVIFFDETQVNENNILRRLKEAA